MEMEMDSHGGLKVTIRQTECKKKLPIRFAVKCHADGDDCSGLRPASRACGQTEADALRWSTSPMLLTGEAYRDNLT